MIMLAFILPFSIFLVSLFVLETPFMFWYRRFRHWIWHRRLIRKIDSALAKAQ